MIDEDSPEYQEIEKLRETMKKTQSEVYGTPTEPNKEDKEEETENKGNDSPISDLSDISESKRQLFEDSSDEELSISKSRSDKFSLPSSLAFSLAEKGGKQRCVGEK